MMDKRLFIGFDEMLVHSQLMYGTMILSRCKEIAISGEENVYAIGTVKTLKRLLSLPHNAKYDDMIKAFITHREEDIISRDDFTEIMKNIGMEGVELDDTFLTNVSHNLDKVGENIGPSRIHFVYNNEFEKNYIKEFLPTISNFLSLEEFTKLLMDKSINGSMIMHSDKELILKILEQYGDDFFVKLVSDSRNKEYFDDLFKGFNAFTPINYINLGEDF